jgi:hypothetical protein
LVNAGAALATVGLMFLADLDPRPHSPVFEPGEWTSGALLALWCIGPYIGLAFLSILVRNRPRPARAALVASVVIAAPAMVLLSPLVYEAPRGGWFDMSWNGVLPFLFIPAGQWLLVVIAAIVTTVIAIRSRRTAAGQA